MFIPIDNFTLSLKQNHSCPLGRMHRETWTIPGARINDQVMAERSALNKTFLPSPLRLRDVSGEGIE